MAYVTHLAPPVAATPLSRGRTHVGLVARVTYPYLLGDVLAYLALTVVNHDIGLMFTGALLVLYGGALTKAVQGYAETRGTDGAQ